MKLRVDQELERAKESPPQSEKPQEKPESKASKIFRGIFGVVLALAMLGFMVYLFLNR
jgi:flagellar biogenesis protein FliO